LKDALIILVMGKARLQQLQDYNNYKITTITRLQRLQELQDYNNYKITTITRLQCMDNYCYSGMQRDMGTLPSRPSPEQGTY
jgi:phage protein U